jgi:hypothetical protein
VILYIEMSTHLQKVHIDSRYRKTGSISSFQIELPNRGLNGKYELKAFNIYNSYWNINAYNNTFNWVANSLSGSIALQFGSYTVLQLTTELKNQLNLATGLVWSVTFSSITFKLTFATTLPFTFDFNVPNSIGYEVGFQPLSYSSTGNTLISVNQIGLSTQPMNYFVSLKEANNEITLLNSSSTTFIVPILTTLNQLNYYEPTDNSKQFASFTNETKMLNVAIYDHNNKLVDLQNDYYFILEACQY